MSNDLILLLPTICLLACAMSLWFEAKNLNQLTLKTKLLASLAFVGFAWQLGAINSSYGQIMLFGLALSLMGDVLLAMKGRKLYFLLGIGAFLLAHIAYAVAFYQLGFDATKLALILPVVMAFLLITTWWLRPHLNGPFVLAVPVYLLAIGVMLVFAWGNQSTSAYAWVIGGASLFAFSDLWVARNRFIQADIRNRIVGLPIYYLAQLMLAYSIAVH